MSKLTIRSRRWLAPVALVAALGLAACGDDDADVSAGSVETESAGAEASYRAAQRNAAEQYVDSLEARAESASAGNLAAQRHNAEQYVESLQDRARATSHDDESSSDEFVPGSRHMPM